MRQLHFVDSRPKILLSPRERELQQVRLRSHAASVSHRAKKTSGDRHPPHQDGTLVVVSSPRKNHGAAADLNRSDSENGFQEDDPSSDDKSTTLSIGDRYVLWPPEFATTAAPSPSFFGAVPSWASEPLEYFTHASIPFHAPVHKIFNVHIIMAELVSASIQHHASNHALMAYTETVLDNVRRPGQSPSPSVLRNANIALSGLRSHLAKVKGHPSDTTIVDVLGVTMVARVTGDANAVRMHNKILQALVQARGGLNALGASSELVLFLLQWESAWNFRTGARPEFLFPEARPPAIFSHSPVSLKLQTLVDKLPIGFRRLQNKLSIYTLEVLVRTAQVAASGSLASLPDGPRRYRDFWEACPCLKTQEGPGESPNMEKLIVQALLLYCFCTFSTTRAASMGFAGARTNLGASIVNRVSADGDEQAALIWCWVCLINSWTNSRGWLLPEGWLLATQMRHAFPEIDHADRVLDNLRLFFSNDEFERRCRAYWDGPRAGDNLSARL